MILPSFIPTETLGLHNLLEGLPSMTRGLVPHMCFAFADDDSVKLDSH